MENTSKESSSKEASNISRDAVLVKSNIPAHLKIDQTPVKGYDFNSIFSNEGKVNYDELLNSFRYCGFQATNVGKAIEEINKMVLFVESLMNCS